MNLADGLRTWRPPSWLYDLDWGTVPAWASAILTSGSLLLGFYILLRDRRKEERQEAQNVICWLERVETSDPADPEYQAHVANLSQRPISSVLWFAKGIKDIPTHVMAGEVAQFIRPDEERQTSPVFKKSHSPQEVGICFQDADGVMWTRDVTTDLTGVKLHYWAIAIPLHPPKLQPVGNSAWNWTYRAKRKTLRRMR